MKAKTRKTQSKAKPTPEAKADKPAARPAKKSSAAPAAKAEKTASAPEQASVPRSSIVPCKAGKLAVVHITDGNEGDCRRLIWSLRSLARYSGIAFDSFVLTPEGANRPDVEAGAPGVLEHGSVHYISDMGSVLAGLSMTPEGWNRAWPFVVLYRLGIPLHPAFAGYDRILYLDTDTLVLSNRVDMFLDADLSGHELGGVVDTVQEEHDHIRRNLDVDLRRDFAAKVAGRYGQVLRLRPYVNAGVLLWNMPEIRKDIPWYKERLNMFWEAECRGRFGFLDQDFVNSMMSVDTGFSMIYNWFTRSNVEPDHCVIRHYCGRQYGRMLETAVSVGIVSPEEAAAAGGVRR